MAAWQPTASLDLLHARARMLAGIRAFFASRDVLEVETPYLSAAATSDVALHSLATRWHGAGDARELYLHTSPEYPMKRLLAAGSGSIYQLCRVFRDDERGRWHHPEFTMLEWYRVGFDHHALIDEVEAFVTGLLPDAMLAPAERLTYRDAFVRHAGIDPFAAGDAALRDCGRRLAPGLDTPAAERDFWLDVILTHAVEPHLGGGRLTFIYDYPASQAALARIRDDAVPVAERFELYWQGVELANGFHELIDAAEQRARFEADRAQRSSQGIEAPPLDERLLSALEAGLPPCAGVALGVDRLMMLAHGAERIDQVLAFTVERC